MTIDLEKAIAWMYAKKAQGVTYSMTNRNGPNSYDCSSAIYYALRYAGATNNGWAVNTEYAHDWLIKNGFKLIAENTRFDAKRGDVVIWGKKGQSAGAGGHMMMFVDEDNIIHCTSYINGIMVSDHDQTWAKWGRYYFYVYRYQGASDDSSLKGLSLREIAQKVISGKLGNGDERKSRLRALGYNPDEVQKKVNEILSDKEDESTNADKSEVILSYNGATITKNVLGIIIKNCKKFKILPSYALTILHFEGLWGTSQVGKTDNNWGGVTWSGESERKSGVKVTQGMARPQSEGGHYVHYNSVDDFIYDWCYLLREGGIYKVAGKTTFHESVKGMFKIGGATYDYAACGYEYYVDGATKRKIAIEQANGSLDRFDREVLEVTEAKIDTILIVYKLDGDLANAMALFNALGDRAIMTKTNNPSSLKKLGYKTIIQVGGSKMEGVDLLLSGEDRQKTLDKVNEYIKSNR